MDDSRKQGDTMTDTSNAIAIDNLDISALAAGTVVVKSVSRGILEVSRHGDVLRVASPWLEGSAEFEIVSGDQAHTAAYWSRGGRNFVSEGVPIGSYIENALPMPFFSMNIPRRGIPRHIADYDSRN